MEISSKSQHTAARVAGFVYLLLSVLAFLAEFYVRANLFDSDPSKTVSNVIAAEQLFRIGIVLDLIGAPTNVVLAIALYTLLKPVHPSLALLATLWRLGEAVILGFITFNSMVVLKLLTDAKYLQAFEPDQLHSLARLYFSAQNSGFNVGLIFFSLGSILFSYLLYKARYIPRILSGWGILGSLLALISIFITIISPTYTEMIIPGGFIPVGLFEIAVGFWLIVKGVTLPQDSR